MKKKKLTLFVVCIAIAFTGWGQRLSPTILASDGGTARSPSISLEWTLGEPAVETFSSGRRQYTQGFHQPSLLVTSRSHLAATTPMENFNIEVHPNPVHSILQVSMTLKGNRTILSLFDMHGKNLYSRSSSGVGSLEINMTAYPAGLYVLHVSNAEGTLLNTFKIVKIN